jgi:NAD-dependent SIR2 family protein deacetylase
MSTKNIVYFLGAGCSKNFGYPLTGDIMPGILTSLREKDLFQLGNVKSKEEKKQEKDLKNFIELLYPGIKGIDLKRKQTGIPSIVEVLSFVDHLCFYNIPPHPKLNEEKLLYFRLLLNRAVAELMMDYQNMEYERDEAELLNKFMGPIAEEKKTSAVTIITTNYDLSIDPTFEKAIAKNLVDYGISFRSIAGGKIIMQPTNPLFKYYKLHGSLNWLKCDLCGYYYIYPNGTTAFHAFRKRIDHDNTCECNDYLKLKTVLVTPSIVRDIRDSNLLQIWKASTEAIRTADKLVFVGYSLPPEDLAIKALIMRGINGRSKNRNLSVEVVQRGEGAMPNYVNMFGKRIKYYANGLPEYLQKRELE